MVPVEIPCREGCDRPHHGQGAPPRRCGERGESQMAVVSERPKLWPHQKAALRVLREVTGTLDRGLIVMPTGTGKTVLFLEHLRRQGKRALILTHRDELIRQTVRAARRVWPGCDPGVIQADRDEWREGQNPVVASVPSLHRRRLALMPRDRFTIVVVDEAHHAPAETYRAVLDHFRAEFVLGVTATPQRLDGLGLDKHFGKKTLYLYTLREAVEDCMLAPPRQFAVRTQVNLDKVKSQHGDFAERSLSETINNPNRNRVVAKAFRKHAGDRRGVVFGVDLDHVAKLAEAFRAVGVEVATVTGKDDILDRRKVLRRFKNGRYQVLVNCMVCTEGWDDPGVDCVVMARPTQSKSLYTQMVGRGLRLCYGKEDCLILDVTDNCEKHKLVTVADLLGRAANVELPGDSQGRLALDVVKEVEQAVLPLTWNVSLVSPWPETPSLEDYEPDDDWQEAEATERQLGYLEGCGLTLGREITKGEAAHLISQAKRLEEKFPLPATPKQESFLRSKGLWVPGMSKQEARVLIGRLMGEG